MKKRYARCSPALILTFLEAQKEPLSVVQIAEAMNIAKRRAFDAVSRLYKHGQVVRTGKRHGYLYSCPEGGCK